jgi:hypothetical protein
LSEALEQLKERFNELNKNRSPGGNSTRSGNSDDESSFFPDQGEEIMEQQSVNNTIGSANNSVASPELKHSTPPPVREDVVLSVRQSTPLAFTRKITSAQKNRQDNDKDNAANLGLDVVDQSQIKQLIEAEEKKLKDANILKVKLKKEIKAWCDQFEKQNRRAATDNDKLAIKQMIDDCDKVTIIVFIFIYICVYSN